MALSQDKRAIDAYVSKELKEFLAQKAKEDGLSMSTLAGDALLQYAKKQGFQETAQLDEVMIEQARANPKWAMEMFQRMAQAIAETPTKMVFAMVCG